MNTSTDIVRFQVGEQVATRSLADWDCVFRFTVVARTEHFVTFDYFGDKKRAKVSVWDGRECCAPLGRHSMAVRVFAGKNIVYSFGDAQ